MTDLDKAYATQLANIEKRSGKRLEELVRLLDASGAQKFGERRDYLKRELGMGHGDANAVVAYAAQKAAGTPPAGSASPAAAVDEIYSGKKAHLRPLHDALIAKIDGFGDYEIAPKKGYVSLRRKKQFAMVGPATRDSVEIGLNAKDLPAHARLKVQPRGSMCSATTRISSAAEVDVLLKGWLRQAYDAAG